MVSDKKDIYKHEQSYRSWQEKYKNKIPDISIKNSEIILKYLYDMEYGLNVGKGCKKGARSFNRLNNLRQRLIFTTKLLEELHSVRDLTQVDEQVLHKFFTDMRNGVIKRVDGDNYKDVANFVKIIKAFWHWWMKINRKKGIELYDITQDLDTSVDKPKWVYLTEEQIRLLYEKAKYDYKVLIMFLYDTGIRAPTELLNIKVSDLDNNYKELMIRDEISKTFGRKIKLMLCSEIVKKYIINQKLKKNDYLFSKSPSNINRYLQTLSIKLFGTEVSPAGQKYSQLTMYDFRHCSCCYWLPRYKSESALKYRFGWKRSDKIHYYSELLGMRDTISEEDLFLDLTKTEIEKQLTKSENKNEILQERVDILEKQMKILAEATQRILLKSQGYLC